MNEREIMRDMQRRMLITEYNRIADAATRGPGQTPHTAKRLESLRKKIEKLGGFEK